MKNNNANRSEVIVQLFVPLAVDGEAEATLRNLTVAILEEMAGVGRDLVARHWYRLERPRAQRIAFLVECGDGHL